MDMMNNANMPPGAPNIVIVNGAQGGQTQPPAEKDKRENYTQCCIHGAMVNVTSC